MCRDIEHPCTYHNIKISQYVLAWTHNIPLGFLAVPKSKPFYNFQKYFKFFYKKHWTLEQLISIKEKHLLFPLCNVINLLNNFLIAVRVTELSIIHLLPTAFQVSVSLQSTAIHGLLWYWWENIAIQYHFPTYKDSVSVFVFKMCATIIRKLPNIRHFKSSSNIFKGEKEKLTIP